MYPSNINPSPIKKTFYILLYRHECLTGKFTTPKIHTKLHFYLFIYLLFFCRCQRAKNNKQTKNHKIVKITSQYLLTVQCFRYDCLQKYYT